MTQVLQVRNTKIEIAYRASIPKVGVNCYRSLLLCSELVAMITDACLLAADDNFKRLLEEEERQKEKEAVEKKKQEERDEAKRSKRKQKQQRKKGRTKGGHIEADDEASSSRVEGPDAEVYESAKVALEVQELPAEAKPASDAKVHLCFWGSLQSCTNAQASSIAGETTIVFLPL